MSVDELKGRLVRLAVEELVEKDFEHGAWGRHVREKRCARAKLHVIRFPEDLDRGETIDVDRCLAAFHQSRSENRMLEVCLGLGEALDRVPARRGAETKPVELREDEPYPVRLLVAGADL